ncbi:CCR4-NOT transcription complex subunit 4 [Schistosoma bovis]|uniref:CCR4-NOT transcription complex subunit 4 n=1 Tax=Schistosoma bovis TaxID=6184 RepID=A0A430QGS5_SCHBO|nr:CCR4-NOT transcription complex subunit 4 [Schistosoma bovis]
MEPMEADDISFYPCDCRYQVIFYQKMILLARVVQPNLIFVVGLPTWISKDKEILKGQNYFGRYGKIFKVEVNQNQTFGGPQECMYLHELGDSAASFTKEEMQAGKHTEYMNKLLQDFCQSKSYSLDSQKEETTVLGSLDSSVSSPNDASVPHTSESSSYSNGRNRFRFEDTSMLSVENSGVQVSDRCTTQSDQTSASLKEIRKLRHTNKDNSNAVSVSDTSLADKSKLNYNNSNKPSSWNHSSSISSSDYPTRKLGKNSFGTFHFKNSSENTNTDKSYVEGTKGNHVRHHNSTQNRILLPRSIPSNQVSTRTEPICTSSNGCHRTWCRPNPENSSNIQPLLGDEPADIDFDPFRESQQGLAELLAAEVSRLNVSEPLFSHRVCLTNGSSVGISHCPSEPQSSSLDTRLPQANFSLNSAQAEKLRSWYSNIVSHNRSNHVDPNKSFNVSPNTFSNLYPPPGFEEAVQGHDQSSDGQFLTSKTDILNSNYPELSYSCPESFGYNNNVRSTNGSLLQSCAFPCSLPFTGSTEKLMTTDNWIQAKKVSDHNAIYSDTLFSSIPAVLPDISNALKQDDLPPHLSSQFMTNIFYAVLNSQSSMNNNESTGTHDKSSTKSPASMFDFSQFVNHLYHQSSGFLDINAHNPNQWSTRVNIPFTCTQSEVLDASIYSSSLAPMSNTLTFGKYGSKMCSLPNSNDYQQHQKMAFSTVITYSGVSFYLIYLSFYAVLNSQSSMNNNESTGTHDKSSTKSPASMFDFSQFVNHLYHQSSGFLDINAHNPNQWSTRVNIPFTCTQSEVLDASIYSSSLAPMSNTLTFGKYGSKMCSLPNSNDYQQHQKMAFSTVSILLYLYFFLSLNKVVNNFT